MYLWHSMIPWSNYSIIFVFPSTKQCIVVYDRYFPWERFTDFWWLFRRISLLVCIICRLHTVHFHSSHPYYSYFHEFSFVGLFVISCLFKFVLVTRYATRRLLVWNSCWITMNLFFTLIDHQNVNVQISWRKAWIIFIRRKWHRITCLDGSPACSSIPCPNGENSFKVEK